jgi:FkbM family methyltransferase
VDIGAHDGVSFSNSYFFEEEREWTGVCFEPNPTVFELLKKNRFISRDCHLVNAGIGATPGIMPFCKCTGSTEMLSGFIDLYDVRHLQRIDNEIALNGGSRELIPVKVVRLNEHLSSIGISHIDYLSIDTEGGEQEILESIDFDKLSIDVISVENNYNSPRMKKFLESKGFRLHTVVSCDEIYINTQIFIEK